MFKNAVVLFFRGRLFQDVGGVIRQTTIGAIIAAIILIGLDRAGVSLWIAVVAASMITGIAQPYLFKYLKYA